MGPEEAGMGGARVLLVAAHPDDEVIGAGGQFADLAGRLRIVHVTDGAPRDGVSAAAAGYANNQEYIAARRGEAVSAGRLAGLPATAYLALGEFADQEASLHLARLTTAVSAVLEAEMPDVVMTHPYEGGHPDHDAVAFAVHHAAGRTGIGEVWEFTSYYAGPAGWVTGRFLPASGERVIEVALEEERRALKRRMFDCFESQREILANFSAGVERFRRAPKYDFTQPAHGGTLNYESYDWGMTGARFRELAAEAMKDLGVLSWL